MILIVVLMVSTRRFKQGMYNRADFSERMHIILRYDLLALFFITLVFTKLIYFNAPIIIYSIAEIMMLVCITILLPRIEPLITNRILVFFTVVFILEQIFSLTLKETLLQRFLILTTAILLLLFLIYQIRNKVFESSGWPSFVKYFRRIMIIIMIVGLLSNLIGMVYLSEIITFGCVNIVFITLVILTTASILQVVFRLLIQSGPAQKLFIIQHHSVLIQKKWERFINFTVWVTWIYLSLNYLYIQEPVTEWLVNAITNRWTIGSIDISISDVLLFIFTIWFSIWISRFIRFILEGDVLPRFSLPRGVPAAISILTNYAIVGFGFFLAMSASGIDMTKFALLAGALGVGIGFGLQNIVNNFISGLILIFERPIQIGDVVDVSGITGKVKRIGIRSSTIRTFTGSEVIVPNANLISNEVINWTLSDKLRRIEIKVGVEYGTDPKRVLDMLNQIAVGHDKILKDPEPFVLFLGFGDSSLDFELRFWTANFETWMSLRTEISVSIYEAFEKAGITIPFPQRDLHIKNHGDLISGQKSSAGTPKSEKSSDVVSKK